MAPSAAVLHDSLLHFSPRKHVNTCWTRVSGCHTRRLSETTAREPYFEGSPYTLYWIDIGHFHYR